MQYFAPFLRYLYRKGAKLMFHKKTIRNWMHFEDRCRQLRQEQDLRYGVLYDTVWKIIFDGMQHLA